MRNLKRWANAFLGFSYGLLGGLSYYLTEIGLNKYAVAISLALLANFVALYAGGWLYE